MLIGIPSGRRIRDKKYLTVREELAVKGFLTVRSLSTYLALVESCACRCMKRVPII
jgi:hypothetical protein